MAYGNFASLRSVIVEFIGDIQVAFAVEGGADRGCLPQLLSVYLLSVEWILPKDLHVALEVGLQLLQVCMLCQARYLLGLWIVLVIQIVRTCLKIFETFFYQS